MDSNDLLNNRFRIRRELGRGGFGAVYLAEDTRLPGRLVALKENLSTTREARAQFQREAVLLGRLRHPNLPQVTDYFIDASGKQYLVMDYIAGDNLRQLLTKRGGPLPLDEALAIVEQVLQAVAYMHAWRDQDSGQARPIIHRDIKPDNIKRTPEGRIVLVDFGIAKMQSDTVTAASARALTPGYAPIEQYHGGTDERSDVYSLGATLYVLLTGHAPPSATSMAAGAPLPSPRTYNPSIPPACVKVIERALALKAPDRYQSVGEMYRALYNRPLQPTGSVAASAPAPRSARAARSPLAWLGLAAALLALVIILVLWQSQGESSAPPESAFVVATATPQPDTPTSTPAVETSTPYPTETEPSSKSETAVIDAVPVVIETTEITATATVTMISVGAEATSTPLALEETSSITTTSSLIGEMDIAANVIAGVEMTVTRSPAGSIPTSTRIPTATPLPTATPTPTRTPTATPRPVMATTQPPPVANSANSEGGPTSVTIREPPNGHASNDPVDFCWQPDQPLEPGQRFDVVFWTSGGSQDSGGAWVGSTTDNCLRVDPKDRAQGSYKWGIWLITLDPYRKIRYLGPDGGYVFSVPGTNDTGSDNTPASSTK